jgi:hypothetical protein
VGHLLFYLENSKLSLNFALEIKPIMPNVLHLDDLRKGCSGIIPSWGDFMADCALFSFASQGHQSGVLMNVQTDNGNELYTITWEGVMDFEMEKSMNDDERATDNAAMCIAILLVLNRTPYTAFIPSRKKSGIDFWLFLKEPKSLHYSFADARLEISGIRKESRTNTLSIRLKLKKVQVKKSNHLGIDVYFAITEFHKPQSMFVTK